MPRLLFNFGTIKGSFVEIHAKRRGYFFVAIASSVVGFLGNVCR